jgi:hypothetical protein
MRNGEGFYPRHSTCTAAVAVAALAILLVAPRNGYSQTKPFDIMEATVESIHAAYKSGQLTTHKFVQMYLDRI